jgi:hypothetical protein
MLEMCPLTYMYLRSPAMDDNTPMHSFHKLFLREPFWLTKPILLFAYLVSSGPCVFHTIDFIILLFQSLNK